MFPDREFHHFHTHLEGSRLIEESFAGHRDYLMDRANLQTGAQSQNRNTPGILEVHCHGARKKDDSLYGLVDLEMLSSKRKNF